MLAINHRPLEATPSAVLATMQETVDRETEYPARVQIAGALWKTKNGSASGKAAFRTIRETLSQMCVGSVRCAYCEDSLADEIEHIYPKSLFPERAFLWSNYAFVCGPCNGPKGSRYGYLVGSEVLEFVRKPRDPIVPPPSAPGALVNPRAEDPLQFLELDLGGVTANGSHIMGTFEILPADGLSPEALSRAEFTISVLNLNREVIRVARENAFGGFRARLREYVQKREVEAQPAELERHRLDLLRTPHLTVFAEMRRQRNRLPEIDDLLQRAPEAEQWQLTPAGHPKNLA
jgi:5-methylcytosine-specific restriction endonuclease McrA